MPRVVHGSMRGGATSSDQFATIFTRRFGTTIDEDFVEVAERVAADAKQAARQTANEAYYDNLKARYNVTYPVPSDAPE